MRCSLTILLAIAAFSAGALNAQASVNLSGAVVADFEMWQGIEIDHGPTAQSITLDLSINSTNGFGLAVSLIDMDEMAANGSTNAVVSGSGPGGGVINLSLNTGVYSGVVEYALTIRTLGTTQTDYVATVSVASVPASAIALGNLNGPPVSPAGAAGPLLDRGVQSGWDRITAPPQYVIHEFDVDFGSTPQAVPFHLSIEGTAEGAVQLWEQRPDRPDVSLVTLSLSGASYAEANSVTTTRSGRVRMRFIFWQTTLGVLRIRVMFDSGLEVTNHQYWPGRACGCATTGCITSRSVPTPWTLLVLLACLTVALRSGVSRNGFKTKSLCLPGGGSSQY